MMYGVDLVRIVRPVRRDGLYACNAKQLVTIVVVLAMGEEKRPEKTVAITLDITTGKTSGKNGVGRLKNGRKWLPRRRRRPGDVCWKRHSCGGIGPWKVVEDRARQRGRRSH